MSKQRSKGNILSVSKQRGKINTLSMSNLQEAMMQRWSIMYRSNGADMETKIYCLQGSTTRWYFTVAERLYTKCTSVQSQGTTTEDSTITEMGHESLMESAKLVTELNIRQRTAGRIQIMHIWSQIGSRRRQTRTATTEWD